MSGEVGAEQAGNPAPVVSAAERQFADFIRDTLALDGIEESLTGLCERHGFDPALLLFAGWVAMAGAPQLHLDLVKEIRLRLEADRSPGNAQGGATGCRFGASSAPESASGPASGPASASTPAPTLAPTLAPTSTPSTEGAAPQDAPATGVQGSARNQACQPAAAARHAARVFALRVPLLVPGLANGLGPLHRQPDEAKAARVANNLVLCFAAARILPRPEDRRDMAMLVHGAAPVLQVSIAATLVVS